MTAKTAKEMSRRGMFYVPTLVPYLKTKPKENAEARLAIKKHLTEELLIAKENNVRVVMGSDIVGDCERPHGRNYEEIKTLGSILQNYAKFAP